VAAKTGTTNDFRDNWTMGYSPDLVVGVWVGNADYTVMQNTTGLSGAAPIWARFMTYAIPVITGGEPTAFQRPANIMDRVICTISGTEPSEWCPEQRQEIFATDQPPLPASEDLWSKATIDTWTGLLATPECSDFVDKKMTLHVKDQDVRFWLRKDDTGRAFAKALGFDRPIYFTPDENCTAGSPHATLSIENIKDQDKLSSDKINIRVIASATAGFEIWRLEFAPGKDPGDNDWQVLYESNAQIQQPENVFEWDISKVPNGEYSLRLRMENQDSGYAQKVVHFRIDYTPPTETPTPVPPTPTPEPPTPIPSITPLPSLTPAPPTVIATVGPVVTLTPTP
jgi:membrane carboxypeptidase/penicillin-binding protein PbpC